MRKFVETRSNLLTEVRCNCCGRKMMVNGGIVQEGCVRLEIPFGFFSKKDGQVHSFDLCEDCYDRVTADFCIPVEIKEKTEYL